MKKIGPGRYTRGWETVGHYMAMLRSSIRLHLFLSFFLALIVGTSWFYCGIQKENRPLLSGYVKASFLSHISNEKSAEFELGQGLVEMRIGHALVIMKSLFGGRSVGFLARQWLFKVAVTCALTLIGLMVLIAGYGGRLERDRYRRGATVVELEQQKGKERRRRLLLIVAGSMAVGMLWSWLSLGGRGREYIGDYFWSSVYRSVPLAAVLASPDESEKLAWYTSPVPGFRSTEGVNDWLRANVYGGVSISLLLVLMALRSCLVWGLWTTGCWFWRGRKKKEEPGEEFELAGVALRTGSECEHFLFSGSPGSGKSTAIKELLDQVRARGQRAIVFDPSGEYIEPYYREGVDCIMNPLDERFSPWTPWADVREGTDYVTMARSLFPSGGRDPFWNDAGAALFAAVAEKLSEKKNKTNRSLYDLLTTSTIENLGSFLGGTSASKFLDPSAGAMPSNLIATVTSKVGSWRLLPDPESPKKAFSLRKFIEDQSHDSWVFLAMRSDHEAALRPLVSLWCDLASTAILSLPPDRQRRFWVVLDEVATLQKLPSLEPLMAKGRKHGAAVILGLQSMAQLRDSYGRDAADALTSQPQTWLALRTVEPGTARWLERALGEAEVDETRESVSMGADSIRDGVSYAGNFRKKSVAMATEIASLPSLEGFLKVSSVPEVYRVKLALKSRKKRAAIYVPRGKMESGKATGETARG